ncbi:Uncharacterised protein [Vibrio cholerae]|nr:Uncharacterised protein [Vibrio cholerae]
MILERFSSDWISLEKPSKSALHQSPKLQLGPAVDENQSSHQTLAKPNVFHRLEPLCRAPFLLALNQNRDCDRTPQGGFWHRLRQATAVSGYRAFVDAHRPPKGKVSQLGQYGQKD